MRSVVVVLPASIWAMMPMFLQRSNGTVLGTIFLYSFWALKSVVSRQSLVVGSQAQGSESVALLPPVMRERLVCFRHSVYIFFLLDGGAFAIGGIEQLVCQLVNHSFF